MKKYILSIIVLGLCMTGLSHAQSYTTVTATLTDSSNQVWANASFTAELIAPFGNPSPLTNQGTVVNTPIASFTDGFGTFTLNLDDNLKVTPSGSVWKFTICPNATVAICSTSTQVVHGTSMNLTTSLSADLTVPVVRAAPTVYRGYSDLEVLGGQGSIYWRTTDNTLRGFNGASWVSIGTGGSGGTPTWDSLLSPANNSILNHNNFSTIFNFGTNTGSTVPSFDFTDSSSNVGTNYLVRVHSGTSSTANPFSLCAQGTTNCIEFNSSAVMQALGTAQITATGLIGTGTGTPIIKLTKYVTTPASGAANQAWIFPNSSAQLYVSENGGTSSKILVGGQVTCSSNNALQTTAVDGTPTCISVYPSYFSNGTLLNSDLHYVYGNTGLSGGTITIGLSGAAVFTNTASYDCWVQDLTAIAATRVNKISGTSFTITGTGTDTIAWRCQGD